MFPKCLEAIARIFTSLMRSSLLWSIAIILSLYCSFLWPAQSAVNPYYANLSSKLTKYLDSKLDPNRFSYEILGTDIEMQDYLGGAAEAPIEFSGLVINGRQEIQGINAKCLKSTNNLPSEQIRIKVQIKNYINAWIADQDIPSGGKLDAIHAARIKVSPAELSMIIDADKVKYENLKNKTANHKINKAETIKMNAVRNTKLVSVGDPVNMVSETSLIKLEFKCKAMSSGDLGEDISLNCPDLKNKSPKAEIIGANLAKLK